MDETGIGTSHGAGCTWKIVLADCPSCKNVISGASNNRCHGLASKATFIHRRPLLHQLRVP